MKTLLLITSLLFSTAFSFAGSSHVTVNVEVESERGTDAIVVQKEGEEQLGIEPGQYVDVTTAKVLFEWTPQHAERTGTGRRSRAKKVDETGHRYHGYSVQVLQDGVIIGEAFSHRSLQKAK
jgi:hypothetical protein